jgi:hypothetical protein
MNDYRDTVTFQGPTTGRSRTGQVIPTFDNIPELTELPARIIPRTQEDQGNQFELIVQGDRAIEPDMVALTEHGLFDILRIARPPHDWTGVLATIVVAERVAL